MKLENFDYEMKLDGIISSFQFTFQSISERPYIYSTEFYLF